MEYPLRIKAAGLLSFFLCLINAMIVIIAASTVDSLISAINTQIHYLNSLPGDSEFISIQLHILYIITNSQGVHLGHLLIEYLNPIFICMTIGMCLGLSISIFSILNMLYMFKKIIIILRNEGPDSPTLYRIWKFSSHNSIFFCIQFIVNSLFLENLFAFSVFCTAYILSTKDLYLSLWNYLLTRNLTFWIVLVPILFG